MIEHLISYIEQGLFKQRSGENVFFAFSNDEAQIIIDSLDYYKEDINIG